ncbi:MAG TPA: ferrous iron transport protein B [Chlamydiales bacterium]|nr:ferrous iron transport protein B [Chlamydiales bacterium]
MNKIKVALAGNPNCGKSTLFNHLTGLRQHVGNWPGKTVEKKTGNFIQRNTLFELIDLPGVYSLSAFSQEEMITRDYLNFETPDVIVQIIDSTNIERNLYLTTQLLEMGLPVVLALNMNRFLKKKEGDIDAKKMEKLLGVPVVKIEANDGKGVLNLIDAIEKISKKKKIHPKIQYGTELAEHISELVKISDKDQDLYPNFSSLWLAIKLLENDPKVIENVHQSKISNLLLETSEKTRHHLYSVFSEDVDTIVANARYGFIEGLLKETFIKPKEDRMTTSQRIDRFLTHKYLGIPIFLFSIYLLFQFIFTFSSPFMKLIDFGIHSLSRFALQNISAKWLSSLIVDGVLNGVGAVLVFVPPIFLLFFFISLLEDCGYLARCAFIMDRFMHHLGLHGKSFIPLLLGFGCNVPAIMATRTLESKKDRILTMLINPFISCGARLPVYILLASAFFQKRQGLVVFSIYVIGILTAILMGIFFKKTIFKGLSTPFVMELPPYRIPTFTGALIHMWERGSQFIRKAGTIIFMLVLIIWGFSSLPIGVEYASKDSLLAMLGHKIAFLFKPLGFGKWQIVVALMLGFVAKEAIISTLGTLYAVQKASLATVLQTVFTPLSAYSFMVFVLLYMPCIAVFAVIKKETGSWKWPIVTAMYTTTIAYIVSMIIYQVGSVLF